MPPQELDKNNGLAVWQPFIYEANKGIVSCMRTLFLVREGKDKYELFLNLKI